MGRCVIKGCPNTHRRHALAQPRVSFYTFPKNKEFAQKWAEIVGLEKVPKSWARICSIHFRPESFRPKTWVQQQLDYLPTKGAPRLRDDAIPTENLRYEIFGGKKSKSKCLRTVPVNVEKREVTKEDSLLTVDLLCDDLSEPETSDHRMNSERTDEEIFPEPSIDTDVEIDHEDLVAKYIKEKKKVVLWKTLCQIYKERAEFAEKQLQEIMDLDNR
ncbi:uncharacterized protein LOC117177643 [Belonocnema kinseyi]|uniref:uncharacterized protein LOC117177643 n=1 Tax=Belonocnema kinseyi TaxID=2817044 RepID=UPI00143D37E3|nr:uncharacterized protein LOC117177643 [Belonocnema kinseyi]XP_033224330.1 uncharacterized protein LOC117177643 [Belonocnema kinseyi]